VKGHRTAKSPPKRQPALEKPLCKKPNTKRTIKQKNEKANSFFRKIDFFWWLSWIAILAGARLAGEI
jgi:hypothetical protein